jgi:hypothetical protein
MNTNEYAWRKCNSTPEQMLWSAVLETALSDALSHRDPSEKDRAIQWFRDGKQHFKMVCDLANYDPGFVQKRVLDLIDGGDSKSIH